MSYSLPVSTLALPLSCGRFAMVDQEDFERVASMKWGGMQVGASDEVDERKVYVYSRQPRSGFVALHRFILGLAKGEGIVDHINGDPLDNRRANLRVGTYADNNSNRQYGRTSSEAVRQRVRHRAATQGAFEVGPMPTVADLLSEPDPIDADAPTPGNVGRGSRARQRVSDLDRFTPDPAGEAVMDEPWDRVAFLNRAAATVGRFQRLADQAATMGYPRTAGHYARMHKRAEKDLRLARRAFAPKPVALPVGTQIPLAFAA